MHVFKCDMCKGVIKKEALRVSFGFVYQVELCSKCGTPIRNFLEKKKLVKESPLVEAVTRKRK
jgi:hypothetical protein